MKIRIADCIVEIEPQFQLFKIRCNSFLSEESANFTIQVSSEDIQKEKQKFIEANPSLTGRMIPRDETIEMTVALRKILDCFLSFDVILIHGAAIAINNEALLFSAPSGTGKSTHIDLWLDHLQDVTVINGDKPFIKMGSDGTVIVCGSPWAGKENIFSNTMVPLKSIILMERAEDNHIEQISFAEAFPALFQQVYRPDDPEKMRKTLRLMQRLNSTVTFWRFQCNNFKDDCFQVAYSALHG